VVSSPDLETGEVSMVYWSLMHILTLFLDIFTILGITNSDKDLEIIILRQQLRILQRKVKTLPRISGPERMVLATCDFRRNCRKAGFSNITVEKVMKRVSGFPAQL
jgi:hypothetical protein